MKFPLSISQILHSIFVSYAILLTLCDLAVPFRKCHEQDNNLLWNSTIILAKLQSCPAITMLISDDTTYRNAFHNLRCRKITEIWEISCQMEKGTRNWHCIWRFLKCVQDLTSPRELMVSSQRREERKQNCTMRRWGRTEAC